MLESPKHGAAPEAFGVVESSLPEGGGGGEIFFSAAASFAVDQQQRARSVVPIQTRRKLRT